MLPDVGFQELLLVAVVALIVVGPRELPKLTRQIGQIVRKARGMAREFQKAFDEMGREAELEELRKEVRDLKRLNPLEEAKRDIADVERDTRAALRDTDKAVSDTETSVGDAAKAASEAPRPPASQAPASAAAAGDPKA